MERWGFLDRSSGAKPLRWHDIISGYRNLVLADPGAGKTFEAKAQAVSLCERGKPAFFIRLEFLTTDFEKAFEVGTAGDFTDWLSSDDEGWFFLDSVDEAQLDAPNALEDALRIFGQRIRVARERAHVCITSRDDAWQALPKRRLVHEYLPHSSVELDDATQGEHWPADGMQVVRMLGFNLDEIRMFAVHQGVGDEQEFVAELKRRSLISFAENPFDLLALSRVWTVDGVLGSRLDVLSRMIDLQLDPARGPSLVKVDVARRRQAAAMLAAAVTMTGKTKICCPDGDAAEDRIDCRVVVRTFDGEELATLLDLGIFDDKVYGAVRFRHREVRELLTAEWASGLLSAAEGRRLVEDLCIRERYGERVLVPRMRPVLPWLILFDESIRDQVLAIDPTVAAVGGDPAKLPLDVRRTILRRIVEDIEKGPA
jgi:hypothetical protein